MLGALVLGWSIKGENILSFLCKSWALSPSFEGRWGRDRGGIKELGWTRGFDGQKGFTVQQSGLL